jgi:undecaprenyl-diphosphatase
MRNHWFGVLWGLILGITEYWPVSVSGHRVLVQNLFGLPAPEPLWEIILLAGILAGTVTLIWHDARKMAAAPFGRPSLMALAGAVPLGIMSWISASFLSRWQANGVALAAGFILNGCLLWYLNSRLKGRRGLRRTGYPEYLAAGLLQSLSVYPGLSRMGLLLCGGCLYQMNGRTTVRIALRISLFVMLGRLVVLADQLIRGGSAAVFPNAGGLWLAAGFLSAAAASYGAGRLLLKLVHGGVLRFFAIYSYFLACVALGLKMLGILM